MSRSRRRSGSDRAGARPSTMRYAEQQPNRRSHPTGTQRGLRSQLARIAAARAAYDILTTIVTSPPGHPDAQRARAARSSRVRRGSVCSTSKAAPHRSNGAPAALLRSPMCSGRPCRSSGSAGERALRNAVAMVQQLAELAPVTANAGARVLVLKGSARLLAGEISGSHRISRHRSPCPRPHRNRPHAQSAAIAAEATHPTPPARPAAICRPSYARTVYLSRSTSDWGDAGLPARRPRLGMAHASFRLAAPHWRCQSAMAIWLHTLEHGVVVHHTIRYQPSQCASSH